MSEATRQCCSCITNVYIIFVFRVALSKWTYEILNYIHVYMYMWVCVWFIDWLRDIYVYIYMNDWLNFTVCQPVYSMFMLVFFLWLFLKNFHLKLYDIKYSYRIQIICSQLYDFISSNDRWIDWFLAAYQPVSGYLMLTSWGIAFILHSYLHFCIVAS